MRTSPLAALATALLLQGCVVTPAGHGDVVIAPALPLIVELDVEPIYFHSGFYYYYSDHRWTYSRARSGPWHELPRDRYPREIRYLPHDRRDKGPAHPDHGDRDYRDDRR